MYIRVYAVGRHLAVTSRERRAIRTYIRVNSGEIVEVEGWATLEAVSILSGTKSQEGIRISCIDRSVGGYTYTLSRVWRIAGVCRYRREVASLGEVGGRAVDVVVGDQTARYGHTSHDSVAVL